MIGEAAPALDFARPRWRPLALSGPSALAGVIGIGAALRFALLSHQSIWLDEAFSIFVGKRTPAGIVSFVAANDNHPPLYYLLLHYWMNLGDSESAVRALSAVLGVLSIFVAYKLGQTLYGDGAGLLVALVVAVSPFLIWYSQETRMYSLLFLLAILSSYCIVKAMQEPRWWWWAGYVIATAAALYTDNGGIWYLLATNVYFVLSGRKRKELVRPWLLAQVAVVVLYLPWLPSFIGQSQRLTESFWLQPPNFSTVLNTFLSFNSYNFSLEAVGVAYVAVIVLWVHMLPKREDSARDLLSCWLFVPIAISFLLSLRQPIFLLRNLTVASIGYYVLIGRAAWSFDSRRIALVAVLPLLLMNVISLHHDFLREKKEEWRQAAAFLDTQAKAGDLLVFDADYVEMPFRYYDRRGLPSRGYPFDEALVHQPALRMDDIEDATRGYNAVWLVLSHTPEVDPEGSVKAWLEGHGKAVAQKDFKDIEMVRYDLGRQEGSGLPILPGGSR